MEDFMAKYLLKEINRNARLLSAIRTKRSMLEKQEDELKAYFNSLNTSEIDTDKYIVAITPQTRESISLTEIRPIFGDQLNPYINIAHFNKISVKPKK